MKNINLSKICNYPGADFLKRLPLTTIWQWKIWNGVVPLAILLSITAVLSMGVLHFFNMFWTLYTSTPMGQQFIAMHPGISLVVSDLLTVEVVPFAIKVTLTAFAFCLLISAAFQLIYVLHYLYLPRKMLGRFILFGIPLTSAVARYIQEICELEYWNIAFAVASFPTLILFSGCFKFSHEHIPAMGDLITDGVGIAKKISNLIKNKSRQEE